MKKDFLIVGQGLAGSFLAWNLLKRGKALTIVDDAHKSCASFAAAGMINPITGKRLVLSARCEELLPFAKRIYQELEHEFGMRFFEAKKIIRLFRDDQELNEWEKKRQKTHLKKYYGEKNAPGAFQGILNDVKGSFVIQEGGYCRKQDLMKCFTDDFRKKGILILERFHYEDLRIETDGLRWKGCFYQKVIFCEGFQGQTNPWFSFLPFNNAKGEILTVKSIDGRIPDAVISFGKWCIPLQEGVFTVGSTYAWDDFDDSLNDWAEQEILSEASDFIYLDFDVISHVSGVRPIMKDLKPAIGHSPLNHNIFIFNGLASKGLLWGPFYAQQMTDYLLDGKDLESDVDVIRFLKGKKENGRKKHE